MTSYEEITEIEMKKSLLLFSGGLDTTTLLYLLISEGVPVQCLGFDYGQQAKQELEYAKRTCEKLNVKYEIMNLKELNISGELGSGGNIENKTDIIIPNRNSIFLSIATNYAIKNNCDVVYIGSKIGEPACYDEKYEFVEQFNELNKKSDITQIAIKAPFIEYDTTGVIDLALELQVPLAETWSCFGGKKSRCGSCRNCEIFPEILDIEIDKYENYLKNLKEYRNEFSSE